MNIIVVGFGKVGSAVVRMLTAEKHDVTVVDNDVTLKNAVEQTDAAFVVGNGAISDVLISANCNKADMVIAVTGVDELNILICAMAKQLGAKDTVGRVRNPEYSSQHNEIKKLGIDFCINPDFEAAKEISRILRFPSAMTVDTFAKGEVEIVSYVMREDSRLDGVKLMDLRHVVPAKALICAVERDGAVYIPSGAFELRAGDRISVVATKAEIDRFFKDSGIYNKKKIKNTMIVGGSRLGFYLTRDLVKSGIYVTLIDESHETCEKFCDEFPKNFNAVQGDGSSSAFLDENDIQGNDAFVALTGIDEENILISMYAAGLKLHKVIAKVNRQTYLSIVKNTDIETFVSPKLICANQIIQRVRAKKNVKGSNLETLHTIVDDKVEALEFRAKANSRCLGIPLKDLKLRSGLLVACIKRDKSVIIPGGNDSIIAGDAVIVVATEKGYTDLDDILKD